MPEAYVSLAGNLADDPELRYTQDGRPWARFAVYVEERREQSPGNWVTAASNAIQCVVNGPRAEHLAESVSKGDRVSVVGRLVPQQWQDKQTGEDRRGWQVSADEVSPSLRFAIARSVKAKRGQQSGPPQGQQGSARQQWGQQPQGSQQGGYDDPPF